MLDFTVQQQNFGVTRIVELMKGGADTPVTEDNKHEYAELVLKQMLFDRVRPQVSDWHLCVCVSVWCI